MLTLVPGGMGGSETYARNLARHLAPVADLSVTAWLPSNAAGFAGGLPENVVAGIRTGPSATDRMRVLASLALRGGGFGTADVVHYPFTVVAPRPSRGQAVVQTLLDVQHLELPGMFTRAELAYRSRFYDRAASRADLVITISEFARQRMVELLGLHPDRVRVAPLGVDLQGIVPNRGAREPFVLYPARGWPHKNHARLVEAMAIVRERVPGLRLVLTGGDLARLGPMPDWVERKGLVSLDELRELYRTAAALAFPSLYEGFGLPPLEAMASGCPVAASDVGAVREVCADAAVLFDPMSPGAIAEGILAAMDSPPALADRGLARAAEYTWQRCADVHATAYRDAA